MVWFFGSVFLISTGVVILFHGGLTNRHKLMYTGAALVYLAIASWVWLTIHLLQETGVVQ
jgi:hypothetical protein